MYPNKIFLGLTLYDILISIGIIICFFVFGRLADGRGLKVKLQNFALICGIFAITLGFGSAVLFQAIYNIPSSGRFEIVQNTGATFYGGLIGGVVTFLLLYFTAGYFVFKKTDHPKYHVENFFRFASCAVPSIVVAHAFGRLGCLTAGCCHGALTDAWYGIMMYGDMGYGKYVPVQLFESLFLFAIFGVLYINAKNRGRYNLSIYMAAYGIWRFLAEFMRADYRGSVGLSVTPSQLIALVMTAGAVAVFLVEKIITDKRALPETEIGENVAQNEPEIIENGENCEKVNTDEQSTSENEKTDEKTSENGDVIEK